MDSREHPATGTPVETAVDAHDAKPGRSRREFLAASGIAVTGLAVGGVAGALVGAGVAGEGSDPGYTPVAARSEPGFDHLVVLMFENRSFDNLLGRLYEDVDPPHGQSFDGIAEGDYSNTAPDGTVVPAHVYNGQRSRARRTRAMRTIR
ncbi:MAG: hypothetical protein ABWZ69_02870 [Mycetocola sp.]